MTDFSNLSAAAWSIRQAYANLETARYGRPWTREEVALGFVGDVGDLMKLVQAAEGVRNIEDHRGKLAHELADCLWSVLVLARLYEVDLEESFLTSMETLHLAVAQAHAKAGEGSA